eukprot:6482786-Amphidinium_carterae.2
MGSISTWECRTPRLMLTALGHGTLSKSSSFAVGCFAAQTRRAERRGVRALRGVAAFKRIRPKPNVSMLAQLASPRLALPFVANWHPPGKDGREWTKKSAGGMSA